MFPKSSVPRAVWALGFVSLLTDVSSELIQGLLPVFLVAKLGASFTTVGMIEGMAEATSLALKVVSGPLSDRAGKRKPLILFGYGMAAVAKPLIALAASPALILGARLFDRTGKGIRGAPRDALIADVTPAALRGEAFGLRQSLDTVGAFLGPLLAIALMWASSSNYRLVFWMAAVPAFASIALLFFGVEEPARVGKIDKRFHLREALRLSPAFWAVAAAGGVFQLARFSESFLILRAQGLGLPVELSPVVLVVMNLVYSGAAWPIGRLSDQVPRPLLLVAGFLLLAAADILLALAPGLPLAFLGVILWGLHLGFTQGVLAALVADTAGSTYRGTAFGLFNLVSAAALLVASVGAGALWDRVGPAATFYSAAALSTLSFSLLLALWRWLPHG